MRERMVSFLDRSPLAAALAVAAVVGAAFLGQALASTSFPGAGAPASSGGGTLATKAATSPGGLVSTTVGNFAVHGQSVDSWGGHFTSTNGYGIVVSTTGTDHWDHGAFIEAQGGYAVYATSANNMAIRSEAGDTTGLWEPVGKVGVVGIGQSRGVYGSGGSSYGVYATSLNWYGVYGRTSRSDNNYGLYSPDNLFSLNINSTGSSSHVVQNAGSVPLEPGDLAVFVGLGEPFGPGGTRIVQVARADTAPSAAVAGVVGSRYNWRLLLLEDPDPEALAALEEAEPALRRKSSEPEGFWVTQAAPAEPRDFLLLVTHGPAEVKASAVLAGAIHPGDLLASEPGAALAVRAAGPEEGDDREGAPPRIVGTALTPLAAGDDGVWVFVRPH